MDKMVDTQLIENIRELLTHSRTQLQQSINHTMVATYWQIGRMIVKEEQKGKERAEYGKKQLEYLSQVLTSEFGKGFDARNLRNMRQFYHAFSNWNAVSTKLGWTHYRALMRIENPKAKVWYMQEAIENAWSARALERQISTLYYERLLSSQERTPVSDEAKAKTTALEQTPKDVLRDPYIFDFLNLSHRSLVESDLEQALIENLQHFLLELGRGFAFVERQQRLNVEDQDFYIDLVFYNFKLKCFLLIDLKLGRLSHQDVRQMDTYVRVYDEHKKSVDDNPTIGLILCSQQSQAVAKYSVLSESKQLFSSKYLPYLPSEEELQQELLRERNMLIEKHGDEQIDKQKDNQ